MDPDRQMTVHDVARLLGWSCAKRANRWLQAEGVGVRSETGRWFTTPRILVDRYPDLVILLTQDDF